MGDCSSDVCSSDLFDLSLFIAQQRDSTAPGSAAINRRLVEAALIGTIQQYLTRNDGLRRQVTDSLLARVGPSLHAIHHFPDKKWTVARSEEHTSELQSLMRISYAVFCLKKKKKTKTYKRKNA